MASDYEGQISDGEQEEFQKNVLKETAPYSIFEGIEDPELPISTNEMIDTIACMDSAM